MVWTPLDLSRDCGHTSNAYSRLMSALRKTSKISIYFSCRWCSQLLCLPSTQKMFLPQGNAFPLGSAVCTALRSDSWKLRTWYPVARLHLSFRMPFEMVIWKICTRIAIFSCFKWFLFAKRWGGYIWGVYTPSEWTMPLHGWISLKPDLPFPRRWQGEVDWFRLLLNCASWDAVYTNMLSASSAFAILETRVMSAWHPLTDQSVRSISKIGTDARHRNAGVWSRRATVLEFLVIFTFVILIEYSWRILSLTRLFGLKFRVSKYNRQGVEQWILINHDVLQERHRR